MSDVYMRADLSCRHNLAIGEPEIVRRCLNLGGDHVPGWDHSYPKPAGGDRLLGVLRELRGQDRHYVVTNGAKQALSAALYAFKKKEMREHVVSPAPYWPSLPTLVAQVGCMFWRPMAGEVTEVLAVPNNPSGWVPRKLNAQVEIWDAAYASPMYGFSSEEAPPCRASVWSAAKLFGLAGARVGWLETEEQGLADLAAEYVEATTSGVCGMAQALVEVAVQATMNESPWTKGAWTSARLEMLGNAAAFKHFLGKHVEEVGGLPGPGEQGMFAWFRARDPAAFEAARERAGVGLVPGEACGVRQIGWWRMSLGGEPARTKLALEALARELEA